MDLQNNEGRQRNVNDEAVERKMCMVVESLRDAKGYPEEQAHKKQYDIIH